MRKSDTFLRGKVWGHITKSCFVRYMLLCEYLYMCVCNCWYVKKAKVSIAQTDRAHTHKPNFTQRNMYTNKKMRTETLFCNMKAAIINGISLLSFYPVLWSNGSVLGCKANLGQTKLVLHCIYFYSCTDLLKMVYFKTIYLEIYFDKISFCEFL